MAADESHALNRESEVVSAASGRGIARYSDGSVVQREVRTVISVCGLNSWPQTVRPGSYFDEAIGRRVIGSRVVGGTRALFRNIFIDGFRGQVLMPFRSDTLGSASRGQPHIGQI